MVLSVLFLRVSKEHKMSEHFKSQWMKDQFFTCRDMLKELNLHLESPAGNDTDKFRGIVEKYDDLGYLGSSWAARLTIDDYITMRQARRDADGDAELVEVNTALVCMGIAQFVKTPTNEVWWEKSGADLLASVSRAYEGLSVLSGDPEGAAMQDIEYMADFVSYEKPGQMN
jgi:hypothetical protein